MYRYVVSFMCALGTMNIYSLRNAINVGVVEMKELHWDELQVGLLFSSYYWGYIATNIPGAWFAKRFGIRKVFGICAFLGSFLTLFMPLACKSGHSVALGLRVALGLLGGVSFPVVYTTCGLWASGTERSRHLAIGFSGTSTGNFVVFPLVGVICDAMGWEALFYFTGGFGIIWSIGWFILVRDTPEEHPWVSEWEKEYIHSGKPSAEAEQEEEKGNVPWISIFTSIYFWALVIPHMCENYLSGTTVSWFPTYMKTYLGFDIKAAAFLASLPFLMKFFVQLGSAFLADLIISKGWWGKTIRVRKVFTSIAFLSSCVAYVFVGCYYDVPVPLAIFCLVVGESFLSFNYPGYRTCLVDFAPKYCGILYGISNTLASVCMAVGPVLAGQILKSDQQEIIPNNATNATASPYLNVTEIYNLTSSLVNDTEKTLNFKENATQKAWSTLFIVCSCVVLVGLCVFLFLGTNEEQEWAKSKPKLDKVNGVQDENGEEKEKEELISSTNV